MAKLRMTYKNLKALRKTKEYQALLVDLVANNIVPKSVAENLLGYNIPANLIGGESSEEEPVVTPDNGEGGESGNTVTLVYFTGTEWETAKYDLTEDPTGEGIIAFAKDAFSNEEINSWTVLEHVEDISDLSTVLNMEPQPETLESGMFVECFYDEGQSAPETIEQPNM